MTRPTPTKWEREAVEEGSAFDVSILWWPVDGRAAPGNLIIPRIRLRCVGQPFGNRYRMDAAESLDPLPVGLSLRQKASVTEAITKAASGKLGMGVLHLAWHRVGEISEWYRHRGEGLERLAWRSGAREEMI